ncbi:hypothetical protein KGM_215450 [Danaus plexippus plexippus]|uniref:Endonuclease-reverse transcriptase n=1 Tax=Danaus plexippus plexippus TaxID=278856 RepID=A0A212FNU2_DANPL|nr:hypothetical protein KGM_215450 [Danaus plexippus plexippus]
MYISEDYSKEVLEKRKTLQAELVKVREKGNIAYLKYDKFISNRTNAFDLMRSRSSSLSNIPDTSNITTAKQQEQLNVGKRKPKPTEETNNKETGKHHPPPSRLVLVGEKTKTLQQEICQAFACSRVSL